MAENLQAQIIPHNVKYFYPGGFVETGIPDRLLCQNINGEFCYLNLENIQRPRLEVITPGFPGVGGQLGSDAESRVAWIVRGRGVYFIDLATKKTGHMVAGNRGRVKQVLMTDRERLLFGVVDFAGTMSSLYVYELSTGKDHKLVVPSEIANYNTLGRDRVLVEISATETPKYTGWYLTDTFATNIREGRGSVLPGGGPLTKALMDNHVHAVNESNKLLHQGKRLLYGWSYITRTTPIQATLVHWSEDLKDIKISPLLQIRDTNDISYSEGTPYIFSADGNWFQTNLVHMRSMMEERIILHIQEHYPSGASLPVSLGYTNQDPGAFMAHSKLGPCFVEQPLAQGRENTLRVFKLNDAIEILKKQSLGVVSKLTQ